MNRKLKGPKIAWDNSHRMVIGRFIAAKETVPKRAISTRLRVLNLSIISLGLEKKKPKAVIPSKEAVNVVIIAPHFLEIAVIF